MTNLFWKGKKVLITGGTSFVGKNLTKMLSTLNAEYYTFSSKQFNLIKSKDSEKVMQIENKKYDFIIHMAALQHAADWPLHHTGEQFYINNLIHLNTLEAWRKHQPQAKFIAVGSSCTYPGEIPKLKETDFDEGKLHESVYSYGFTKKLLKVGLEAYKDQYKLRGTFPIFATLYGPYDDFNIETAHVVGALIYKFSNAKKQNIEEIEIWGDGTQNRELIYVEDQIEGLLMAAQYCEENLINVGTGIETTIKELAEVIKEISGYKGKVIYNPNKFVGVKDKVLDITKAKETFGWTIKNKMHSLEEGLRKTFDWYETNQ